MDIKREYYKSSKGEFDNYLSSLKNSANSLTIFPNANENYFYCDELILNQTLLLLNKKQYIFDSLMDSFTDFGKKQIIQSFFLNEIESTNSIESIFSTRHDIFSVMNKLQNNKNGKIDSIISYYQLMLNNPSLKLSKAEDIRIIYDCLIKDTIVLNDKPDGLFFRKNSVYISDGVKNIHQGFYPEEKIIKGVDDFLNIYNYSSLDTYLKGIITHFMIETIHPFYDGNGRLGRFLFSFLIYKENKTYFSFLISHSINLDKNKYYKALKEGRDIHQFGCINEYVSMMIDILSHGIDSAIKDLKEKKDKIDAINPKLNYTKSEKKIFILLMEGSILSDFGLSNEEILNETKVSKRTLMTTLNKFREEGILDTTTFGKYSYHKFK